MDCKVCGGKKGQVETCPECGGTGQEAERIRRTTEEIAVLLRRVIRPKGRVIVASDAIPGGMADLTEANVDEIAERLAQ